MNPALIIKVSLFASCLLVAFLFGSTYQESKWQKRELEIHQKQQQSIKIADAIAIDYEKLKASKNAQHNQINKQIYQEIQSAGYSCVIPANGVQLLAKSIKSANNSGNPTSPVPSDSTR